jgi:hypothetical protein
MEPDTNEATHDDDELSSHDGFRKGTYVPKDIGGEECLD